MNSSSSSLGFFAGLSDGLSPHAFSVVLAGTRFYYDNCASVSVVNSLSLLLESERIVNPFKLGGIANGILLTHKGFLSGFPRSVGEAYYSADASSCLFSLGYLQECGGSYASVGRSQLVVKDPAGVVIDVAEVSSNRLPAVSSKLFAGQQSSTSTNVIASVACIEAVDSEVLDDGVVLDGWFYPRRQDCVPLSLAKKVYTTAISPISGVLSNSSGIERSKVLQARKRAVLPRRVRISADILMSDALTAGERAMISEVLAADLHHANSAAVEYCSAFSHSFAALAYACNAVSQEECVSLCDRSSFSAFISPFGHVNAEQRDRCERAEKLHLRSHLSDDILCESLINGGYAFANITPADVRLNRALRGVCPNCVEGKMKKKSMPPSDTAPADRVGALLCFDLESLIVKSKGGNIVSIRSVDEFSGDVQISPSPSKSAVDLFKAIMHLVYTRYNAYGHKVSHMVADSEPCLLPLVAMLGLQGILLTFCPPGQHQQRMERVVGFSDSRKRALLAGLPFNLPSAYDIYADRWVADSSNENPNSRSRPSTADIIVTGRRRVDHYKHPNLGFGDVCVVAEFIDKRRREAAERGIPLKDVHVGEIGVCLGYSVSVPGAYDFCVSNGSVVSRRVVEIVQVHPFDWKRKTVLRAELRLPSVHPYSLTQQIVQGAGVLQPLEVADDPQYMQSASVDIRRESELPKLEPTPVGSVSIDKFAQSVSVPDVSDFVVPVYVSVSVNTEVPFIDSSINSDFGSVVPVMASHASLLLILRVQL